MCQRDSLSAAPHFGLDDMDGGSQNKLESPAQVCAQCGVHCCRLGGAVATREEVLAVRAAGYKDHFERVAADVYVTRWTHDGTCPYLVETTCSIYDMRPLRCRAFPVFQTGSGEVFLAKCPLEQVLSSKDVRATRDLLLQCPDDVVRDAAKHLNPHASTLEKRMKRYRVERIS